MGDKRYPPLSKREAHLLWCAATLAGLIGTPGRLSAELFDNLIDRLFLRPRHRLIAANLKDGGYIRPGRTEDEITRDDLVVMADRRHGREPDPKMLRRLKRLRNQDGKDEAEDE